MALLAVAVIGSVSFIGMKLQDASKAATAAWNFAPSGLNGSGFQNVVAYSPFKDASGKRPVLIGADVAGIHRSLDGGKNWLPSNVGIPNMHIASIMWSETVAGKVYVATDSRLAVSTDFGLHWKSLAAPVNFDANGVYLIGGAEHPRPTGNLLAQDNSGTTKYLYAATATQGVKRSSDDGATWDQVALAGNHLRSIALDPANPNRLFVATVEAGLQVTTTARTTMTFSRVAGSPDIPEEMQYVAGKLYVATHNNGIQMYDGAWHPLNNGISLTSKWESITGYKNAAGATVLYAGCTEPATGKVLMKSVDGGASWVPVSTGANVTISTKEYGQTMDWWSHDSGYLSVKGNNFVVADIAVDPDNPDIVITAGRGGAKAVVQSADTYTWYHAVHGLMVTVNMAVVADPNIAGRVYVGNMDYTFLTSTNNGRTIIDNKPSGAPSTGDYITLDLDGPTTSPAPVYLAASVRGQNTGSGYIYSNPDPVATPNAWTDENIPVKNDVLVLGVGHDAAGARVILASITGNGLYRKVGGTWSKITGTAPFTNAGYGTFGWVPKTRLVYAMDGAGVWRSNAAGAQGSWVKIAGGSAEYGNINSLVVDPTDSNIVYASDNALGGVVRINGANTASPTVTKILSISSPGPLVITQTGQLLAHDRSGARLMRAANPKTSGAATATNPAPGFTNVADPFFRDNTASIRSLAVGADDYIYTADNGQGFTVGTPAGATTTPPPAPAPAPAPTPVPAPSPTPTPTTPPADTTAPTVIFGSPSPGGQSTVKGTVDVTPTATDNVGVTKVELFVDGILRQTDAMSPYGFRWDTTTVANGAHTLQLKAYDAAGNIDLSGILNLTVSNLVATKPGDANGDGRVNGIDYSMLTANFGENYPSADFDKNGVVDAADLSILLANWTW